MQQPSELPKDMAVPWKTCFVCIMTERVCVQTRNANVAQSNHYHCSKEQIVEVIFISIPVYQY